MSEAIEILESCDTTGRVHFQLEPMFGYINRTQHGSDTYYFRELVTETLRPLLPFISRKFEYTKAGTDAAKVEIHNGTISFLLAPVLLLPNDQEAVFCFRDFLIGMRPFFLEYAEKRPRIQIWNKKVRNRGRTVGEIDFLYNDVDAPVQHAVDYETREREYIENTPVICQWLRECALDLNRMGPHSWATIRSDLIFEYDEDPVAAFHLVKRMEVKKAKLEQDGGHK